MPLGRRMEFDARGGRRAPRRRGQRSSSSAATRFWAERRGRSRPGAVKRLFVGVNRSDAPVERGSGKNEGSRTVKSARSDVPRRPARLLRFERARADGFRAPREFKVLASPVFSKHTARASTRGRPRREGARRSATRKEGTESARHRGRRVRGHRAIRAGSVGASSAETTMAPSTRRRSSASNNAAPGDKKKVLKDVTNGGRGALPRKIPDAGPPTAPVADHGVGARTRSSRKKPPANVGRTGAGPLVAGEPAEEKAEPVKLEAKFEQAADSKRGKNKRKALEVIDNEAEPREETRRTRRVTRAGARRSTGASNPPLFFHPRFERTTAPRRASLLRKLTPPPVSDRPGREVDAEKKAVIDLTCDERLVAERGAPRPAAPSRPSALGQRAKSRARPPAVRLSPTATSGRPRAPRRV